MRKILLTVLGFTTFVGVIMIAVNFITGNTFITFISLKYVGGTAYPMYYFDINRYIKNLGETFQLLKFEAILPASPTRPQWTDLDSMTLATTFIAKIIIFAINCVIYTLNVTLLIPLKFIYHIFVCIFAVLGINTTSMGRIITYIYQFNIPNIPISW